MTLDITKKVEQFINEAVQSGRYASADEMIARLVEEEARRVHQHADGPQESPDEWALRLQAWVTTHPSRAVAIEDTRESIYAGRGE